MTVKYRTQRSDIWHAYWFPRDRRKLRLMMVPISFVLLLDAAWTLRDPGSGFASRTIEATLLIVLAVMVSPVYPLLRFKSDERLLTIGPNGISTTIGKLAGDVEWSKVASIASEGERLYIVGKNHNSFVVPFDAFFSEGERERFIELATKWFNDANRSHPS